MDKRKKVSFTVKDISSAVMQIHALQQNKVYNLKRIAYKKANNLLIDFILASAKLGRYTVSRTYNNDKKVMTQNDVDDALLCIADFDIDKYKKLHLTLQHFVMYCSNLSTHGILQDDFSSVVNEYIDRLDVIRLITRHLCIDFVSDAKVQADNKCAKCGLKRHLDEDGLCEDCITILNRAIEYRCESFSTVGSAYKDFSTQIKNFVISTEDKTHYLFEIQDNSTEVYEPFLPFSEYQDTLGLI